MDEQDFVVLSEKDVSDYNETGLLPLPKEDLKNIQQWLDPTDYLSDSSEYNKHLTSHVPGTGDWMLSTNEYEKWHHSKYFGLLWVKAIPGAGKSVLAASLVATLANTERVPVLHFFFRQIIATNQEPQHLVRDWLSQILQNIPSLQSKLYGYIDSGRELDSVSFDELWQVFIDAISLLPKVYCVVDGLDEMNLGNDRFLYQLLELGRHKPSSIKVMMTSRLIPRIEKVLKHSTVIHLSLFEQAVNNDITYYVKRRLQQSTSMPESTHLVIREALSAKAQGLFLYARLMLDDILDPSKHDLIDAELIHDTLSQLPSNLADVYNRMLADHSIRSGTSRETQFTILQWVTQSSKPLRLLELSAMIDFLNDSSKVSRDTKAVVRAGCGPLLEILEDETVSIIHHSFTEFLIDNTRESSEYVPAQFPVINREISQRAMALVCLKYVTSGVLDTWMIQRDRRNLKDRTLSSESLACKLQFPFLDYAAENWFLHVTNSSDETLFFELDNFLRSDSKSFSAWLDMRWPEGSLEKITPLHVAAFTGLSHYTQHLLQKGHNIDARDGHGRSPISWAASKGHADVVRTLLENGAQADLDDDVGLKPLHYSATANRASVIEILLEVGVDPLTPKTKENPGRRCGNSGRTTGETAVQYAAQYGHVETICIFKKYLTSVDLNRALHWAVKSGKTEVASALLESPNVDVNNLEGGATPLFYAASGQDPRLISVLLEKGADVSIRCRPYLRHETRCDPTTKLTVMHALCGCLEKYERLEELALGQAFKLLHAAGCEIDAAGPSGTTPLHYAVRKCFGPISPILITLLLENGANATAKDDDGNTPLHLLDDIYPELVDLLCKHGANVNDIRKIDGSTPIHTGLRNSHHEEVLVMLAHTPDPDIHDLDGNTVLHIAFQQGHLDKELIGGLLQAGYDVNARNDRNETPLHAVRRLSARDEPVLKMMIDAGANLEAKDVSGYTVIFRAREYHAPNKTVQVLLEVGSDINARDLDGKTLLHLACHTFEVNQVQFLIDAGGDPLATDYAGDTILHEASKLPRPSQNFYEKNTPRQFFETISRLLGSSVAAKNNTGRTALHVAAGVRPLDSRECGVIEEPMDILLELTRHQQLPLIHNFTPGFLDINARDNDFVRPIHVAAAISVQNVDRLIRAGADATVLTAEGQSPLHVACKAGESNVVGLLVDHYAKHKQLSFMEHADTRGRTALFDACVSGRVGSVKILLDAGANLHHEDKTGGTPLSACAEFQDKGFVIKTDPIRPRCKYPKNHGIHPPNVWSPPEPYAAGIRQIVRLLVFRGAKMASSSVSYPVTSWMSSNIRMFTSSHQVNSMCLAVNAGNEVMVEELDSLIRAKYLDLDERLLGETGDRLESFEGQYLTLKSKHLSEVLKSCVIVGDDNLAIVKKLLLLDNETGIEEVARLGADLIKPTSCGESCLHLLASCGRTSLLEKIGSQASMVTEAWIKEKSAQSFNFGNNLRPILHTACDRALPNLDTILLLLDKLKVEVNARSLDSKRGDHYHHYIPGPTALHVLSRGQYWWQPHAIKVLLHHGADIESKDQNGETPLQVAMNVEEPNGYWRGAAAETLLDFGANPNIFDDKGLTCLNHAGSNVSLVHKLIEKAADIALGRQPAIFSAIKTMDVEIVRILLSNSADCNARRVVDSGAAVGGQGEEQQEWDVITWDEIFPIQFAASSMFNTPDCRSKALQIIDLLLHAGANPFEVYEKGVSILHELVRCGGILEPFLVLKGLDLEACDSWGRTLLLVACVFGSISMASTDVDSKDEQASVAELLHSMGANIEAIDNKGRTIFHYLVMNFSSESEQDKQQFMYFLGQPTGAKLAMQKDHEGFSPLHNALRKNQLWIVETLLAKGADPLEADPNGDTALHHFSKKPRLHYLPKPQIAPLKRFLNLGVDINTRNKLGETAIFVALADSSAPKRSIAFFTDNGADPHVRNFRGETLLHIIAKMPKRRFMVEIKQMVNTFQKLIRLGLDPMMEDNEQRSALDVAAACGNDSILALFKRGNQVNLAAESVEEDSESEEEEY
ncbi:hypothetical protein MMC17_002839 [Xylographa soralifera]|nr:hypothetical protein [Xylographa soralifera]